MQDLPDLIDAPSPIPAGGTTIALPSLSIYDIARLLRDRREARRRQLIADHQAVGIGPEQTAVDLDAFADRVWDADALTDMVRDRIDGQAAVLEASVAKGTGQPASAAALLSKVQWTDGERFAAAARVVGLTLTYGPADPQTGTPEPQADAETGTGKNAG